LRNRSYLTILLTFCVAVASSGCALDVAQSSGSGASSVSHGRDAKLGEFPWMAALVTEVEGEPRVICGGVLIDSETVLTAWHCILGTILAHTDEPRPLEDILQVAVGWITVDGAIGLARPIACAGRVRTSTNADLAWIRLAYPAQVQPVPIAEYSLDAGITSLGYGNTTRLNRTMTLLKCADLYYAPRYPTVLQVGEQQSEDDETCQAVVEESNQGLLGEFCGSETTYHPQTNGCASGNPSALNYGDSGGAALQRKGDGWALVGINVGAARGYSLFEEVAPQWPAIQQKMSCAQARILIPADQ
jgi:hypothetical protein